MINYYFHLPLVICLIPLWKCAPWIERRNPMFMQKNEILYIVPMATSQQKKIDSSKRILFRLVGVKRFAISTYIKHFLRKNCVLEALITAVNHKEVKWLPRKGTITFLDIFWHSPWKTCIAYLLKIACFVNEQSANILAYSK